MHLKSAITSLPVLASDQSRGGRDFILRAMPNAGSLFPQQPAALAHPSTPQVLMVYGVVEMVTRYYNVGYMARNMCINEK